MREQLAKICCLLSPYADAAMRQVIRPDMFFEILGRIQRRPSLKHDHVQSALGEYLGRGSTGRAGADNANIVSLRRANYLSHEISGLRFVVGRASLVLGWFVNPPKVA
jgi:hypothetical protein